MCIRDSHELAHRKEMNHSPLFWKEVAAVLPDYRERRAWLREHGRDYGAGTKQKCQSCGYRLFVVYFPI